MGYIYVLLVAVVILGIVVYIIIFSAWRDPLDFPLPEFIAEPPETVAEYFAGRATWYSEQWGNAYLDGPDVHLPTKGYWHHGRLYIRA